MTLSFPDLQGVREWCAMPLFALNPPPSTSLVERREDRFRKIKLQLLNVVSNLHVDLLIDHLVILEGLYTLCCSAECSRSSTTNMFYYSNVVAGVQCFQDMFIV